MANNIDDFRRVRYLPQLLKGNALSWYMSLAQVRNPPFDSWDAFVEGLRRQFLPPNHLDLLRRRLRNLRQSSGSVQDYTSAFQNLLTQLPPMDEGALLFSYISGLHPVVRDVVVVHEHTGYLSASAMAARVACQRDSFRTPSGARRDTSPFSSSSSSHTPMDLGAVCFDDEDTDDDECLAVAVGKPVQPKVCKRCLKVGHTSPTCPAPSPHPSVLPFGQPPRK